MRLMEGLIMLATKPFSFSYNSIGYQFRTLDDLKGFKVFLLKRYEYLAILIGQEPGITMRKKLIESFFEVCQLLSNANKLIESVELGGIQND